MTIMGMDPIHNGYKTQVTGASSGAPASSGKADVVSAGKADILPTDPTAGTSSGDSTYDALMKLGADKMGKKQEAPATSADPMGDILNTLDQVNNQGVPNAGSIPLAKVTIESLMAANPDFSPEDILTKVNSVLSLIDNKIKQVDDALANGGGTPQQIKAAQAMKAELQDYHNFYLPQRDKAAALVPQYNESCTKELTNFQQHGGTASADTFDFNHDGWIGKPNGPDSYQVASYVWDKAGTDPLAKQMVDAYKTATGKKLDLKCDFKKGDIEYWAVNPTTQKRIQLDPVTGKVVNEQVPYPDSIADLGAGFGGADQPEVVPNDKGEIVMKTGKATSSKLYAQAGLELHEAEYVWVKADADKNPDLADDGSYKPVSFALKDGKLVQNKPPDDGSNYIQVYVKSMDVSSENGDIVVQMRGGETDTKILTMRVKAPPNSGNATDTALAITSGDGAGHRVTPMTVNAGAYQSTCRQGIKDTQFFTDLFKKSGVTSPNLSDPAILDTLQNFEAGDSGEIKSLLNRGIAFKGSGNITGTNDNDLFEIEDPPAWMKPSDDGKDGAYASVVTGGAGHNALWGGNGSKYINGMTLVSITSTNKDRISVGVNAFGEEKTKFGNIQSTKGSSEPNAESNKLYIRVHALQSDAVAIESVPDEILNSKKTVDPSDPTAWKANDDHYDVQAKQVAITSLDPSNPNQTLDPDMWTQADGRKPIQGILTTASTGDFLSSSKIFSDATQSLDDSINKKASANVDLDWTIPGATLDWTKGKYYQADKTTLDSFFADFTASKMDSFDPFAKQAQTEAIAAGGTK